MPDNVEVVGAGSMIAFSFISFLAGGGTVLLAGALVGRAIMNSPVLIAYLEHLAQGLSPEWRDALHITATVVSEATDQVPYAEKPLTMNQINQVRDAIANDVQRAVVGGGTNVTVNTAPAADPGAVYIDSSS